MKFKIISNQQTPKVPYFQMTSEYIQAYNKLYTKFLSFASRQHNCAGLAANQVSLDGIRLMQNFFAIKVDHFWDIIINPIILDYSGENVLMKEGCLTWLGKTLQAHRYENIAVWYMDIKGNKTIKDISGWEAQVWQHECDHLNGVVEEIID